MKNILIFGITAAILSGCGGGGPAPRSSGPSHAAMPEASGPISQACLASDRTARSYALCGCIQAVANQTLNGSEQRRAAAFYSDPHRAQEVRQSDNAGDERFWDAYKVYGQRAEHICR